MTRTLQVPLSPDLQELVPGSALWATEFEVGSAPADQRIEDTWGRAVQKWGSLTPEHLTHQHPLSCYRELLRAIGLRKVRPAAENLIRRFILGKAEPCLHSINRLVDAGNVVAAETGIPVAMFDAARVRPPLVLRLTTESEPFTPIGSPPTTLPAGSVVLSDSSGVVSLFCSRDGERTKVTDSTTSLMVMTCQVPGVDEQEVKEALARVRDLLSIA